MEVTGIKPTWERHHHAAPTTDADTRAIRLREGQCPTCGVQTHEVRRTGLVSKSRTLVPLTRAGETQRGRCLLCHPVPGPTFRSMLPGSARLLGPRAATPPPTPTKAKKQSEKERSPSSSRRMPALKPKSKQKSLPTIDEDATSWQRRSAASFAYVRVASEQTIQSILDMEACGSCSDIEWTSKEKILEMGACGNCSDIEWTSKEKQ